jgi:hypothetical protein
MGERGVRNAEVRGSVPLISTHPLKIIIYILVCQLTALDIPYR